MQLVGQMTLAKKGILLLLLPALMQVIVVIGQICLYFETEFYPLRAIQDKALADAMGRYLLDDAAVLQCVHSSIDTGAPLDASCDKYLSNLIADQEKLKALWQEFPSAREKLILFNNEREMKAIRKDFATRQVWLGQITSSSVAAVDAAKHAHLAYHGRQITKDQAFAQARAASRNADNALKNLAAWTEPHASSPQMRSRLRGFYMLLMVSYTLFTLVLLMVIGFLFTRSILSRLTIILSNHIRLTKDQPLHPPVKGSDEIAELDGAFHEMAVSIKEATHARKAMIENARDLICSMDEQGRFLAVSRASQALLGFHPEELVGKWFLDLVDPIEQESTAKNLMSTISGAEEIPFETRLQRKSGSSIDLLWSASWSPADRTTFCVAHDITEQKAAERFQQEVIQMVSHDLKSPLAAISFFHELMEEGMMGPLQEEGIRQVKIAQSNTQRMLTLINELLEIERMKSGMLTLDKVQVSLANLYEQAVQTVLAQANSRGLKIEARPTNLNVYADEHRLLQILVKLLSNAIKVSPEGGRVTIFTGESPGYVTVNVMDEGPLIPELLIDSIFNRFSQVQPCVDETDEDSSLGLAICQSLVELHGGEIHVESNSGKGNLFSFSIPIDSSGTPIEDII